MFNFFGPKIPQIDAKEVKQAIDNNEKCVVLDVRTPGEFASGKIKGAINLPLDQIPNRIEQTIPDKNTKIYVYCRSGARSAQASAYMLSQGYTNIFNMQHGLIGWSMNGYKVE